MKYFLDGAAEDEYGWIVGFCSYDKKNKNVLREAGLSLLQLQEIKSRDSKFEAKNADNQYLVVKRVMEWVDRSIKKLQSAKRSA